MLGTGNSLFAKQDLKAAYHQIPLDRDSQSLTTIITHVGTYRYTRTPFGIKSAPSAFQRIISQILNGLEGTLVYLDDILIAAKTREELRIRTAAVQRRLAEQKIQIKEEKSLLETDCVDWLGYEISAEGIRPTRSKAQEIKRLKEPSSVKEVRQVMGVVSYYGKFIPKLSEIARPLYSLLKKTNRFCWTDKHKAALDTIKSEILKRNALMAFDTSTDRQVRVRCDASDYGMGAILEQKDKEGEYRAVVYFSSLFRNYEKNYSISEKEAFACVAALQKFRKYLLGRHVVLQTDHRALQTLLSQSKIKRTLAKTER